MNSDDRLKKLEEVVSDILIDTHRLTEDVKDIRNDVKDIRSDLKDIRNDVKALNEGQQTIIRVFNTFGDAMLEKLSEISEELKAMRQDMNQVRDHEERIRNLENHVFKKGA